ncbi:DUF433 domain-containing protein [Candidatus Kuenenia sp.]
MERITVNPKILGGKPIIKGTRILEHPGGFRLQT